MENMETQTKIWDEHYRITATYQETPNHLRKSRMYTAHAKDGVAVYLALLESQGCEDIEVREVQIEHYRVTANSAGGKKMHRSRGEEEMTGFAEYYRSKGYTDIVLTHVHGRESDPLKLSEFNNN